jgi:hypothetical protein
MMNFYVSSTIISDGPRTLTIYDEAIGGTRDENARDNSRPIPLCFLHLSRICKKKIGNKIGSEIMCFFSFFFCKIAFLDGMDVYSSRIYNILGKFNNYYCSNL